MRLSFDTLFLLASAGDELALHTLLWIYGKELGAPQNKDAEAWSTNGLIGAGWPGTGGARRWPIGLVGISRKV